MATNEPVPAYRPIRIEDRFAYVPLQGETRVKRVHYELADAHRSYVDIPAESYSPETVQAALEKEATTHFDVMAVQGPMLTPPTG